MLVSAALCYPAPNDWRMALMPACDEHNVLHIGLTSFTEERVALRMFGSICSCSHVDISPDGGKAIGAHRPPQTRLAPAIRHDLRHLHGLAWRHLMNTCDDLV